MSMRTYETLKDKFCDELEEMARKPKLTAGDVETVYKLVSAIKDMEEISMLDDGYSEARDGRVYDRESSYARKRDSMGRYSRADGRGYSRADGHEDMMEQLDRMMDNADSDKVREAIRRFKRQIETL